jgi:hypothetical protein
MRVVCSAAVSGAHNVKAASASEPNNVRRLTRTQRQRYTRFLRARRRSTASAGAKRVRAALRRPRRAAWPAAAPPRCTARRAAAARTHVLGDVSRGELSSIGLWYARGGVCSAVRCAIGPHAPPLLRRQQGLRHGRGRRANGGGGRAQAASYDFRTTMP